MLFPTGVFALFFALVFTLHWGLNRWPLADRLWLLLASAGFYAFWDARLCLLLGGVGLWAWGMGRLLAAGGRRWLWPGVAGVLAVLGLFKYADFFLAEIAGRFALLFGSRPSCWGWCCRSASPSTVSRPFPTWSMSRGI